MGLLYHDIAKSVALAAGQLKDADDLEEYEAAYAGNLPALLGGMEIPYSALRQLVLDSEKRLVELIGNTPNGLYRSALFGRSNALTSGAQIPTASNDDADFEGTIGAFYDVSTGLPLTPKPVHRIMRINRLYAAGALKVRPYHFGLSDMRVLHTRDAVYMESCSYDPALAAAQYDNEDGLGESVLPIGMATLWRTDVLANSTQENWFVQEGGQYRNLVTQYENNYRAGLSPS